MGFQWALSEATLEYEYLIKYLLEAKVWMIM